MISDNYKILVRNTEGHEWKVNIKWMLIKLCVFVHVECIKVAHDMVQWQVINNIVFHFHRSREISDN